MLGTCRGFVGVGNCVLLLWFLMRGVSLIYFLAYTTLLKRLMSLKSLQAANFDGPLHPMIGVSFFLCGTWDTF